MILRALFNRLAGHPLVLTEIVVISLIIAVLSFAQPVFVIQVLNRFVAFGVDATLWTLTVGVVAAIGFEFVFRRARVSLIRAANAAQDRALSERAFGLLATADMTSFGGLRSAERRQISGSVDAIRQAFQPATVASLVDLPFALLFVFGIALLNTNLGIVVMIGFAAGLLLVLISGQAMRRGQSGILEASGQRSGLMNATVLSPDTVRVFNGRTKLGKLWAEADAKFRAMQGSVAQLQSTIQVLGQSLAALVGVAIICVGAIEVVGQRLDVGAMIGANILAARALQPLLKLSGAADTFAKARQAFALLAKFQSIDQERTGGAVVQNFTGRLTLDDVSFAWPGSNGPLFESVSLELAPGAVLSVNGSNGAGKTTMARVLAGLLTPTRGSILVDGVDVRQVDPMWWRSQLVYFPQEPVFLPGSVRDAITALNPDIEEAALGRLIETTGLKTFVAGLPNGLESAIKDGGTDLALGIRRRLALARALASDGRIAILDEPTESMDAEGRAVMSTVVRALSASGRTIIILSHDPSMLAGQHWSLDLNAKPKPRLEEKVKRAPVTEVEATS